VELGVPGYLGSPGVQHQLKSLKANLTREAVIPTNVGDVHTDEASVNRT
jgi:hypothetical protein